MSGSPLSFKNAHPYFFEAVESFSALMENGELAGPLSADRLQSSSIGEVIFFTSEASDGGSLPEIERQLQQEGVKTARFDAGALNAQDFGTIREHGLDTLRTLKNTAVLLIYPEVEEVAAESFIATNLLTLKDSRLTPERLWKLIAGQSPTREQQTLLEQYADFLQKPEPPASAESAPSSKQEQEHKKEPESQTGAESAPGAEERPVFSEKQDEQPAQKQESDSIETQFRKEFAGKMGSPDSEGASGAAQKEPADRSGKRAEKTKKEKKGKKKERVQEESVGSLYNPDFKLSRMTIRIKLASIISAIVVLSLFLATFYSLDLFRDHTTTLIQEYNLSLARLIGRKVEDELSDITFRTGLLTSFIDEQKGSAGASDRYSRIFFLNNPDYLFLGFMQSEDGVPQFQRRFYNQTYLREYEIKQSEVTDLHRGLGGLFARAAAGEIVIENLSPGFTRPLLAVLIPLNPSTTDGSSREVLVSYIDSSSLIQSFRSIRQSDFFHVMIINDEGFVIAHSDDRQTMSRANHADMPIVKTMLESPIPNGSRRFDYNNVSYLGSYQNMDFGGLGVISMVRADRAFDAVYRIQNQNIIFTLMVLTAAFITVFFFAKTISSPIVRLVGATEKIESGHYDIDIKPTSHDEIGVLTNSFQHMAKGLEEREKIKDTFGKFVNKEIAERALREGITLGGDKRKATVLFSDLRDFTVMSEANDPVRVVQMLNGYFTGMVKCIHDADGVVDKFIGDAIMAHWGALQTVENDARNAVESALAMRRALIEFNNLPENSDLGNLRIGVGINTGPVISGQIGSEQKLEFTVIGDTVNLASRIEFMNKHFGTDILISSYTYSELGDDFDVVEMPAMNIKGKSQPEVTYAVLGRKDDSGRPGSLNELRDLLGINYDDHQARQNMEKVSSDSLAAQGQKAHGGD